MRDFSKDSGFFSEEEKIFVNRLAVGVGKEKCCEMLDFTINVTSDDDCVAVLQSLYAKIRDLSVEEWADLQNYLPFDVTVSDDDFSYDEDTAEE